MRASATTLRTLVVVAFASPAAAQVPSLQRVDSLLAAGATEPARAELDRVWADSGSGQLTGERRAHALHLRASLADDFRSAESDLLEIVLGHPSTAYAPVALLRLGQGLLETGQTERAGGYLRRLVRDYPGSGERETGLVWLARAQRRAGGYRAGCETTRNALERGVADAEIAALLERERAASCEAPSHDRFAIQLGAFRDPSNAAALVDRARAAGAEPRVVMVGSGSLLCVRVGHFSSGVDAERTLRRLRGSGLHGSVVDDVADEKPSR